jgi:hypothetical protein
MSRFWRQSKSWCKLSKTQTRTKPCKAPLADHRFMNQMKSDEISGGPSASAVKSLQRRFQLP